MFVIGFITLLLLIPLDMIESLITERKVTRKKAVEDITSKWGSEQTIVGPCLVLPYSETIVDGDKRVETENYLPPLSAGGMGYAVRRGLHELKRNAQSGSNFRPGKTVAELPAQSRGGEESCKKERKWRLK